MKLWQGQLDSNQRMSASKTDTLPLGYTPISIKHDLHASATSSFSLPHLPHPRACLILLFLLPLSHFVEALVYLVPWRWVRHYNGTPMGGTGDGIPELHWRQWIRTILNYLPSYRHTIAVAAASFLLFEKPSRNPLTPLALWRRDWDSNPRTAYHRHRTSRPAH